MPVYPGDPPVEFSPAADLETDGFRVTRVSLGTHAGTHLDAPAHFLKAGGGVDGIQLDALIGPARMIDLTQLTRESQIVQNDRLLIRTGWSNRWGSDGYFDAFPPFPEWFVKMLAAAPAALLGVETPSLHPDHEVDAAFHRCLLGAGVVIVENLVGLGGLPDLFDLAILPLPLRGLDGSPCRAVAWHG